MNTSLQLMRAHKIEMEYAGNKITKKICSSKMSYSIPLAPDRSFVINQLYGMVAEKCHSNSHSNFHSPFSNFHFSASNFQHPISTFLLPNYLFPSTFVRLCLERHPQA